MISCNWSIPSFLDVLCLLRGFADFHLLLLFGSRYSTDLRAFLDVVLEVHEAVVGHGEVAQLALAGTRRRTLLPQTTELGARLLRSMHHITHAAIHTVVGATSSERSLGHGAVAQLMLQQWRRVD